MPGHKPRHEPADVGDAKIRVQRHFEHAARQRQPRFLKSPETSHAPAHPNVKASFFGNRGRQFADHHGSRQTPEQRRNHKNQQRGGVAGLLDDVFESVRAAGHHEIRCRDHGHDGNLAERLPAAVLAALDLFGLLSSMSALACNIADESLYHPGMEMKWIDPERDCLIHWD